MKEQERRVKTYRLYDYEERDRRELVNRLSLDEFFDQPCFICDDQNQGARIRAICVLFGVQVDQAFVVGPITIRPRDEEKDRLPEHTQFDFEYSVLELNYIDTKPAQSIYTEPLEIQEAAFKAAQLLVDNWCAISPIYHFDEGNEMVGISGSYRFAPAQLEPPRLRGYLKFTHENKELFTKIFRAAFGELEHTIDRFSRACTETRKESILDFVIALESTLGYGLESEIAHRLASRGAFLLSLDPSRRETYYRIFKTLYNMRSRIAHGVADTGKIPGSFAEAVNDLGFIRGYDMGNRINVWQVADAAREITRQVLIRFIMRPALLDNVVLLKLELGLEAI